MPNATVYITDRNRAVGVVGNLLSGQKAAYVENIRAEYLDVANKHARAEADKKRLPLAQARDNAIQIDWSGFRRKPRNSWVRG